MTVLPDATGPEEPIGDDLSVILSPRLQAAVEIWNEARLPGEVLARKERLDIVRLGRAGLMPIIWLVERGEDALWRYRVSGEAINGIHGRSLAGLTIDEIAAPDKLASIYRRWNRCVDEQVILHSFGRIFGRNGTYSGERLVLPMVGESAGTVFLLGATDGRLAPALMSAALSSPSRPIRGHENDSSDWIRITPR